VGQGKGALAASISGSIMGDEYTESFFFCDTCRVYTVEIWRGRFCGEDSVVASGPLSKAEGDAKVELIKRCPEPWNKGCRCEAHREYFGSFLD
jgi:hypothetical protein